MFDKDRAEEIAGSISDNGGEPSVRAVRRALVGEGKGGSHRRVRDFLGDWRDKRGLSEFEADTGMPPEFQGCIDAVTSALWAAALREAESLIREERALLRTQAKDTADELAEARKAAWSS